MTAFGGCANCEGRCCTEYVVPVNGYDVWRLAVGTGLRPDQFVRLMRAESWAGAGSRDDTAARLVEGGPGMSLVLDRRLADPKPACVFLVELRPGRARCGVYANRPAACNCFPFEFRHGSVSQRADTTCGADSWNLGAVDLPAARYRLLHAELEWVIHRLVVERWNAVVDAGRDDDMPRLFSPLELFDYLLLTYDRIDTVRESFDQDDFERFVLDWRSHSVSSSPMWTEFIGDLHRAIG